MRWMSRWLAGRSLAAAKGNDMGQYRDVAAPGIPAALALALLLATATPAVGTPASGFSAVQQFRGTAEELKVRGEKTGSWDLKLDTKGRTDLWVVRNSIAVGGQSGWHMHPGPSLITVTVGEITAYDSDDPLCTPTVHRAGETFVDSGLHAHLLANRSGAPAETVAVQFLPEGGTRRIDAPQPNNCNF